MHTGFQRLSIFIGIAALGLAAATVLSQPETSRVVPDPPKKPAVPAPAQPAGLTLVELRSMLEPTAAVAEEHQLLEAFVGSFKSEWRMFTAPGAPPITSHGTTTGEWILGKRFVAVRTTVGKAAAPDTELESESLAIYGFDTRSKKYTVVTFDTLGTYWVSAEGDYDKSSKGLRLVGTEVENGETMKFKWTVKLEEGRNSTMVELRVQADDWMKVTEVVNEKGK